MSGPLLPRGLERIGAGARRRDPEAGLGEMVGHQRGDVRLVVDHENAVRHDDPLRPGTLVCDRLRSAARSRSAAHGRVVVHDGVENGRQQPALRTEVSAEAVEHELGDRGVADHLDAPEHLEVARHGRLGRSSTACRSDTKSGAAARQLRMRSRVGSATVSRSSVEDSGRSMWTNIYTCRRIYARADARAVRKARGRSPHGGLCAG